MVKIRIRDKHPGSATLPVPLYPLCFTQCVEGRGLDGEDGAGLGEVEQDGEDALPLQEEAAPVGGGHVRHAPHSGLHIQPALLLSLQ
jgi:hypothetical protein